MLKIQEIPQRDLDSLALLSNLADDDYSRLAGAFHAAKPCLQIRKFIEATSASLPRSMRDVADAITETVMSMQTARLRLGVAATEFITAVFSSDNIQDLKLPLEKHGLCRDRLQQIMAIDSILITAKAASVLTAHESPFESARVFTDVRPIFGEQDPVSENAKPRAAVLVHMLQLRLAGEESRREIYVALDNRDLQTLIDALNRAKAKAEELSEFVTRGGLPYLEP